MNVFLWRKGSNARKDYITPTFSSQLVLIEITIGLITEARSCFPWRILTGLTDRAPDRLFGQNDENFPGITTCGNYPHRQPGNGGEGGFFRQEHSRRNHGRGICIPGNSACHSINKIGRKDFRKMSCRCPAGKLRPKCTRYGYTKIFRHKIRKKLREQGESLSSRRGTDFPR